MSGIDITLREAVPSDAENLLNVMKILNRETPYLLVNAYALNMTPEGMAHEIGYIQEQANQLIFLALDQEEIVGILTVSSEEDDALKHIGEVGISILKEYWGMGLGTIMLDEVIHWATHSPLTKRLEIKVQARNKRAIHLYDKVGFQQEGVIRRGFLSENNDLLDVVLMSYLID